jgi:hypothetical protein
MKIVWRFWCVALACAVAAASGCTGSRRAHEEMLSFRARIHAEMTPQEIEALFMEMNLTHLRYGGAAGSVVTVGQAVADGVPAKEWVLWISLRQGRAAAVRIRTEDSSRERPHGAPEDIVWQPEDDDTPFTR